MIRNDYDPLINLFRHCFDHKSWNPRLVTALDIIVALVFFIGGGFLVYGIFHVTGDNRAVAPLINSLGAFQSLQASLHMTEYAAYRLSVATNISDAATLVSLLQEKIYHLSVATDQLVAVNSVLSALVSDNLLLSRQQWSRMIALASGNTSASIPYLLSMSALYTVQLSYSENIMNAGDSEGVYTVQRTLDETHGTLLLMQGAAVFVGCSFLAILLMAGLRASYYRNLSELAYYRDLSELALAIKTRFLTLISHEMRTPLNGVMGPLQLLYDSLTGSEHQPLVRASINSAEALLSMVNNLLDYRLLDEDDSVSRSSQHVVLVDLHALLLDIEAMILPAMKSKGLDYRQLYYSEAVGHAQDGTNMLLWPSRVKINRDALVQVMMNLLSNAHKFTSTTGSVTLVTTLLSIHHAERRSSNSSLLSASASVANEKESIAIEMDAVHLFTPDFSVKMARFRIEIIDTGIGISPNQLKNVFEVFSGDNDITTRAFDGLGLGLAISSKLATKKLGSHIAACSVLGHGSTFSFEMDLPIDTEACSSLDQPVSALQSLSPSSGWQTSPSILPCHDFGQHSANAGFDESLAINHDVMFTASSRPLVHTMASINEDSAELACAEPAEALEFVAASVVDPDGSAKNVPLQHVMDNSVLAHEQMEDHSHISPTAVNANTAVCTVSPLPARYFSPPFNVVTTRPISSLSPANARVMPNNLSSGTKTNMPAIKAIRAFSNQDSQSVLVADEVLLRCDSENFLEDQNKTCLVGRDILNIDIDVPNLDHHLTAQIPNELTDSNVCAVRLSKSGLANEIDRGTHTYAEVSPSAQSDKIFNVVTIISAQDSTPAILSLLPQPACKPSGGRFLPLPRPGKINVMPSVCVEEPSGQQSFAPRITSPLASARPDLISPLRVPRGSSLIEARSLGATPPVQLSIDRKSPNDGVPLKLPIVDAGMPTLRILLVEKNQFNQKVATDMLVKMGHSVVLAESGQEALDKWRATMPNLSPINLQSSAKIYAPQYDWKGATSSVAGAPNATLIIPFDICLMELSMPVMDGYEAASKIRSLETFMTEAGQLVTPLWIVALCANAIQANPKLLPHGMQGFLSKPIRKSELFDVLLAFNSCRNLPLLQPRPTLKTSVAPGRSLSAFYTESGIRENSEKLQCPPISSNKTLQLAISAAAQQSPLLRPSHPSASATQLDQCFPFVGMHTALRVPLLDVSSPSMVVSRGLLPLLLPLNSTLPLTSPQYCPLSKPATPARIVARRSGSISAVPQPPFILTSPRAVAINRRVSVSAVGYSVPDSPMEDNSVPPLRILLAEDNLTNQRFALALLGKMGHVVVLAENGQQAVDMWRATQGTLSPIKSQSTAVNCGDALVLPQSSFDICLMDLSMPVLDGYDAATKIRALEKSMMDEGHQVTPLPIVAVSANSIAAKPKCMAVGMQAYLTKPMRKSELIEVMLIFGCGRFLPVVTADLSVSLPRPVESEMVTQLVSLRILLAENNPSMNRDSVELLESLGHSVVVAYNGLDAIDTWRAARSELSQTLSGDLSTPISNLNSTSKVISPEFVTNVSILGPFDVCLVDLALPIMDGFMTVTTIRAVEKARSATQEDSMPIFALSFNPIEEKARCLASGMQGCFAKPLLREELVYQLSGITSGSRQSISVARSEPTSPCIESSILGIRMLPLHVLVVVDNRLVAMLEKLGHSVVLAQNGQEAVEKWRATMPEAGSMGSVSLHSLVPGKANTAATAGSQPNVAGLARPFDICLMDLFMPVMDGFSTTNIIRAIEQSLIQAGEHIIPLAIVAVTGTSIESKDRCLAAGIQGFLSKPVNQEELVFQLQVFGSQRHQRKLTPSARPALASTTSGIVSPFADLTVQFPLTSRQALAIQHQRMQQTPTAKRHSLHSFSRPDVVKLIALTKAASAVEVDANTCVPK